MNQYKFLVDAETGDVLQISDENSDVDPKQVFVFNGPEAGGRDFLPAIFGNVENGRQLDIRVNRITLTSIENTAFGEYEFTFYRGTIFHKIRRNNYQTVFMELARL